MRGGLLRRVAERFDQGVPAQREESLGRLAGG